MLASDCKLWAANSSALRAGHSQAVKMSRRLICRLLSTSRWVSRSSLVWAVKEGVPPEILARLCQREAEISHRPNLLGPDDQAWSGARRAVGLTLTYWRSVGVVDVRGEQDAQEYLLLRVPRTWSKMM